MPKLEPTNPKLLLTPKELADAIGASESSLRRWVDTGQVRISRTAGGHRRIPVAEALRFIRDSGATVVRPELLGFANLRAPAAGANPTGQPEDDPLFRALRDGQRDVATGMLVSSYLKGQTLPALFDGPVRAAMHRMGELWKHDQRGILVEHRATETCTWAVARLRDLLPPPTARAPLAVGAAPEGDPYVLPSLMAALVLAEVGFRDINFGANTPLALLADQAVEWGARLVWISVSAAPDSRTLRTQIEGFVPTLARRKIDLAIGGLHSADVIPRGVPNVHAIGSMAELAGFARGLLSRKGATKSSG